MRRVLMGLAAAVSLGMSVPASAAAAPPTLAFVVECESPRSPNVLLIGSYHSPQHGITRCREEFDGRVTGVRPFPDPRPS